MVEISKSRRDRIIQFITSEKKSIFSEIMQHAAKMEAEAITDLLSDLEVLDSLEDVAREISES